jgi:hypothetical protein
MTLALCGMASFEVVWRLDDVQDNIIAFLHKPDLLDVRTVSFIGRHDMPRPERPWYRVMWGMYVVSPPTEDRQLQACEEGV